MSNEYTASAGKAINYAAAAAQQYNHAYIGTEHLLLGLIREKEGTAGMVLAEFGVDEKRLLELIDRLIAPSEHTTVVSKPVPTPRTRQVIARAFREAAATRSEAVGTEHLLIAMLKETDCVGTRLLYTMGVDIQKLFLGVLRAMGVKARDQEQALQKNDSATPTLDQYGTDLTEKARNGELDPCIGREKEIDRLIRILSRRSKNNPCLVGEPGVGKTAITEGLAQRIAAGDVPHTVKDKRLVTLDLSGMVAGSKYRGEFEERIKNVVKEVSRSGNILLFVDELHTIIGAGGAEGALDASNILKPSLSRGEIQLIGATTLTEYRKYIEKDAALERRFQPVTVDEPSAEETVQILRGLRHAYEEHHGVEITEEALQAAVRLSERYIHDRFLPDKAIDVIDEAAAAVQLQGHHIPGQWAAMEEKIRQLKAEKEQAILENDFDRAKELQELQKKEEQRLTRSRERYEKKNNGGRLQVTEKEIAATVSGWTRIPVDKLAEQESKRLARLEQTLHKRVIGQEEAVSAVAKAIKRGRVGLKDPRRPIGSFMFLGPTGVGKTELSKALAEAVFGSEEAMIRVDMSEYMEKHSVSKLIGSPPGYVGYDEGGQLSEKIRRNPYCVLLFDEIEKAHPDVFNILLQVLDDGRITDAQGREVSFKETCIIMTSNSGAQAIMAPKRLGFLSGEDEKKDYEHMKGQVMEEVRRSFKPEFLNRIDDIIVFHSLTKEEMLKILRILLKDLAGRCKEQMEIDLHVTAGAESFLLEKGYEPKYGARPLRRTIQNLVEDVLAEKILAGEIRSGDKVRVTVGKEKLLFKKG